MINNNPNRSLKRILLFMLLYLAVKVSIAQNSTSKHHYFSRAHRSRIVVNKKFNRNHDSAYFSYEVMTGNTNAWNGDVYNQYPSFQFLCTYDNNKRIETGVFGVLTYANKIELAPNGFDAFISIKLKPNVYLITDVYTFGGNADFLASDLGYNAKIYNQYTTKIQWNANDKQTWYLGYSVLNDRSNLQQSVYTEFDYSITKNFPVVLGYASNSNLSDVSFSNFYMGIGMLNILKNTSKYDIKLTTTFNPIYIDPSHQSWPLTVLLGVAL